MTQRSKILPIVNSLPKHRVSALLSAGWARVIAGMGNGGKAIFADKLETTSRTVENGLSGTTLPEAHTVLNSLAVDPTALDEIFASYGLRVVPLHVEAANDICTAAGVIHAMGELVRAMDDGRRDHNETLTIATLLRPHMAAMQAIISEADELRGAA